MVRSHPRPQLLINLLGYPQLIYKYAIISYMAEIEAYCVKCRAKRPMKDAKEISMKGKGGVERKAMAGACEQCGTRMFKILGKK